MSETETQPEVKPGRFQFGWVLPVLFRPGAALEKVARAAGDTWLTPLLISMAAALAQVAAAGWVRQTNPGPTNLPEMFQYWSPDQQTQYMQAQAAAQGPAFLYIFPGVFALLEVWLGWLVLTGLLHLVLTLLGGRGSTRSALNLVAWAGLPLAVRDLVRTAAILIGSKLITSPGLSGFAPAADAGGWALYAGELLKLVDLYLIWHAFLLARGARATDALPGGKALAGGLLTVLAAVLLQALPGFLIGRFAGLNVALPFFGY